MRKIYKDHVITVERVTPEILNYDVCELIYTGTPAQSEALRVSGTSKERCSVVRKVEQLKQRIDTELVSDNPWGRKKDPLKFHPHPPK